MKRSPLKRKTKLRRVNQRRRAKRFRKAFGAPIKLETGATITKADWIRSLPCVGIASHAMRARGHNHRFKIDAAHARAGHTRDAADLFPACDDCHRFQHARGIKTFARLLGIDLNARAQFLEYKWQTEIRPAIERGELRL